MLGDKEQNSVVWRLTGKNATSEALMALASPDLFSSLIVLSLDFKCLSKC
jgi:hypothetical protein